MLIMRSRCRILRHSGVNIMTSLFDDLELVDDVHEFDNHAIRLAEIAARDEGYNSLFEAAQYGALSKVNPSGVDRVASIPVASRLAVALCDWYDCNLHDLPQHLRGGYATNDGNILMATGYGYDLVDKDMLGDGTGRARREFAERYDYLLHNTLDEQTLQRLNAYTPSDDVEIALPFESLSPRVDKLADGSMYWTEEVLLPKHLQDLHGGSTFLVRSEHIQKWLGTPYDIPVTTPANEGLVILRQRDGDAFATEPIATVDALSLMHSINPQAHLMHHNVNPAFVMPPAQLAQAVREYNSRGVQLQQSPFVTLDAGSWDARQNVDNTTVSQDDDRDVPDALHREQTAESAPSHSSEAPTYQRAQRHKRARSR